MTTYTLEPGPIAWIDVPVPIGAAADRVFTDLVARRLGELGAWDAAFEHARQTTINRDPATSGDGGDDPDLVEWSAALVQDGQNRAQFLPGDELRSIDGLSITIDTEARNVPNDPAGIFPDPPVLPYNPDPSNPPAPVPEPPQ